MRTRRFLAPLLPVVLAAAAFAARPDRVVKTNEEWKRLLTPEQYTVLREKDTDAPFTGEYWNHHAKGTYVCAACGLPLFTSKTKFDSGTGWPSFWQPIAPDALRENGARKRVFVPSPEGSRPARGVEVVCARCDGHLGDVFDDGPKPTGLRYCINGTALKFVAAK